MLLPTGSVFDNLTNRFTTSNVLGRLCTFSTSLVFDRKIRIPEITLFENIKINKKKRIICALYHVGTCTCITYIHVRKQQKQKGRRSKQKTKNATTTTRKQKGMSLTHSPKKKRHEPMSIICHAAATSTIHPFFFHSANVI